MEPTAKPLTNRERLELIQELKKQTATEGDVWFLIPTSWFIDWKRHCEQQPDAFDTEFRCLDTSSVEHRSIYFNPQQVSYKIVLTLDQKGWLSESSRDMMVSYCTWSTLSNWYA